MSWLARPSCSHSRRPTCASSPSPTRCIFLYPPPPLPAASSSILPLPYPLHLPPASSLLPPASSLLPPPSSPQAGAKLFLVSIGTPERAVDFSRETGFPPECLFADPEAATYAALRLKKGVKETFFRWAEKSRRVFRGAAACG